jgi:hypothetical protein
MSQAYVFDDILRTGMYLYLFQIPSDPYKGTSSHTTGYRKHHFSLQNVPFTKEQVSGHNLYIQWHAF